MNSLKNDKIIEVLKELHEQASKDKLQMMKKIPKLINFQSLSAEKKSETMKELFLAVDKEQGDLLYTLARGSRVKSIFEFGTSFGISALYLGAAAKENKGKVITTELNTEKCTFAKENIKKAGLEKTVKIIQGDALETVKKSNLEFDFVFLDGWKEMYLPIFKLLEPKLKKGAIIVADNVSFKETIPYLKYVKGNKKYVSTTLTMGKDDTELSFVV